MTLIPIVYLIATTTNSIHFPQFLTLYRLCSDDTNFEQKAHEMTDFFINRHFPNNTITRYLDLVKLIPRQQPNRVTGRKKEMFYLTTHSTHFIYGYMASDIWLRTILIVRKETRCRHIGYSYRLTASHRQDNTYHGLCYTSHGALVGTRNSSMVRRKSDLKSVPHLNDPCT